MTHTTLPSPNYDGRNGIIDMLVLHYTGMKTGAEALTRLCDAESKVSAHYMVEEDGRIFALVPEAKRAWHAGVSHWRGKEGINDCSIGIEIVNPGHEFGYRPFPRMQMDSVVTLCKEIVTRHHIPSRNVIGHSDIAPTRKEDPGELFDWDLLAKHGVGLLPPVKEGETVVHRVGDTGDGVLSLQKNLQKYGYAIATDGVFDTQMQAVIRAFQRHFNPQYLSGQWTTQSEAALQWLLARINAA